MSKADGNLVVHTFSKLDKVTRGVYVWIILFIFLVGFTPFAYEISLDFDKIIYASAGLLTFIAIFYSLLISREGIEILDGIKQIINDLEKEFKEMAKKEIDKAENLKKCLLKLENKNSSINFVKRLTNLELLLFFSVIFFMLSIYMSLFNHSLAEALSYMFLIIGMAFSSGLVLEWTVIVKIVRNYLNEIKKSGLY